MKPTDLESFYKSHVDLYSDSIGVERLAGAEIQAGWYALEVIAPPKSENSSSFKGIILHENAQRRHPLVYKVVLAGDGCKFQPGDFVLSAHLAQDQIERSSICFVPADQIIIKWGHGIERES
jgi:hypothetical protein